MNEAFAVLILLSFLFLNVWWVPHFVASFFSLLAPAVPISPPLPNDIPVNSPGKVQPSMETSYISAEPDPDAVSAAEYTQMERLLVDMQLKQKLLEEIKMPDFALESQGGSVISSRCSETYSRSAFLTFFGFRLMYPSDGPRTVIQDHPVLQPGKCWAFYGGQGTLLISLSHPVSITHVTLDHVPRYNTPTGHIDSAPKDFEVFGMNNENEAGTLLGRFTYDQNGEPTQTFELPSPSDIHHFVKLRVLTNWGQDEYTCLYRFRVHGKMA
uniref:SUN domain-containing protein 1-like n=1 Tax=Gouania willdenowi TaxID=441366 RepID=A0A8C5H2Q1_GOUWI